MSQSSLPLFILLEPSRRLRWFLHLLHVLAASAALTSGLPIWGKIAALIAVACSARRHLAKAERPPIACLSLDAEHNWHVGLSSGGEIGMRLLSETVVTSWLVVLHFRDTEGRFHAVPVLPDSVDRETYRRLCAHLRMPPPPP